MQTFLPLTKGINKSPQYRQGQPTLKLWYSTISVAGVIPLPAENTFSLPGCQNCEHQLLRSNTLSMLRLYRVRKALAFLRGFYP